MHDNYNFNPRSSCEERLYSVVVIDELRISIHAPHARSDLPLPAEPLADDISIHAPHARSDKTECA